MSNSGNIPVGDLVSFRIKINGQDISGGIEVLALEVEQEINQIASAKVQVLDGQTESDDFPVSSSQVFVPGGKISIEAGYNSTFSVIFEGIVASQNIRLDEQQGTVLEVECFDEAIRMKVGRKTKVYTKKGDSEIIGEIIGNYAGLSADVAQTDGVWPEMVQYYVSDWDFLLSRAEANGWVVSTLRGKVSVFAPDGDTSSVLTLKNGEDLLSFNAKLDSIGQLGSVEGHSWDFVDQEEASGMASNTWPGPGNLSSKTLSEVVNLSEYQLQSTAPLDKSELTTLSKGVMVKSSFSKIQGEAKVQGNASFWPGVYVTLKGLGDRFSGDHFVSKVCHSLKDGNWISGFSIGLSPEWHTSQPEVMAPPASGFLPGARGLFNATVKKTDQDPDGQYRLLVNIPLFEGNGEGLWARLSNFYASSGAGAFFMPEVGDEVVVGFLNEDPRFPIILGSLYSSVQHKPASGLEPNEENSIKAITTRSGVSLKFDDERKDFSIITPNQNTAIFSDEDKKITIKDQSGNSIEMSEGGITIKSATAISIETTEKLTLKGEMGVSIQSGGGDVVLRGLNVRNEAEMEFVGSGAVVARLEGGSETEIKGGMVMIN